MQQFKPGQQVICVHPTGMWLGILPGPFHGDIVTISKYSSSHPSFIELEEYPVSRCGYELPDCFLQTWFVPTADINQLINEEAQTIAQ